MQIPDIRFWAGTDESFAAYLDALKWVSQADMQAYGYDDGEEEDAPPRLLTKQGDVGVITIAGPLVPGAPWYARYRGMTGYEEIRAALVAAAQDDSIGAVVLDINSGGGAVSGVTDVAALVATIDAGVKPVHTYSDGMIASAAYWVGVSARRIDIGTVTEAGSIGVLTVHQEITKMLDMAGITAKVLRSGEFKALGNSMEKLSPRAEAEIQAQLDQMDGIFIGHVAPKRGLSVPQATEQFGKGRVFIGDRAVAVGLVDGVSNFDAVISKIQGAIDSEKSRSQYGGNFQKGPVVKTALTEQQVAALAEGAGASAGAVDDADAIAAAAEAEAAAKAQADAKAKSDAEAAAQAGTAEASKPSELVAYLQTQLTASQSQVADLTTQVRDLKAANDLATGAKAAMRPLVEASLDRLHIALGGSAGSASALTDNELLAEHTRLRAQFETKFKAGGVAAVSSSGSSEKSAAVEDDDVRKRRIAATRPQK